MPPIGALLTAPLRWSRHARRHPCGSPRILVIGERQGAGIARAMACLAPEAAVTVVSAVLAARRHPTAERLLTEFDRHDVVFLSPDLPGLRDGGTVADLRRHGHVTLVPTIRFSAFHPDLVQVGSDAGARVHGPMGLAHSALALFGFLSGLSRKETAGLFQRNVFERVGYFDAWDASVRHLCALGAQADYDLDGPLARWARRGCFMHATDHVKLHVAADLARGLLDRAAVPYHACALEDHLSDDPGEDVSWPVYPEIAAHYGVPGSALFLRPASHPRAQESPTMALGDFIDASFHAYARLPGTALSCRRVAAWQADRDLSAALRSLAIETRH